MLEMQTLTTVIDFHTYPSVGVDDWNYTYQSAQVRSLEMQLLSRAVLMDMANAPDFGSAVASLGVGDYALPQGGRDFAEVQAVLLQQRAVVRELFAGWMLDERVVALFRSRSDFANLRLALRRALTDKPVGDDYSAEGNVPLALFKPVFEEDNYALLPEYLREATERAALAYYQNKVIPEIDHAIDEAEAEHKLEVAWRFGGDFLLNLFRVQIDLANIRTMLRLKFAEREQRRGLLQGGYVEVEQFRYALEMGYEAMAQVFFATPYHRIVDLGAAYVASNKSFLKVEQQCEEYLGGFLKATAQITAGPQPIVAYLLMKEQEIRTVRLILTAKKNHLDTKLILDRISS